MLYKTNWSRNIQGTEDVAASQQFSSLTVVNKPFSLSKIQSLQDSCLAVVPEVVGNPAVTIYAHPFSYSFLFSEKWYRAVWAFTNEKPLHSCFQPMAFHTQKVKATQRVQKEWMVAGLVSTLCRNKDRWCCYQRIWECFILLGTVWSHMWRYSRASMIHVMI